MWDDDLWHAADGGGCRGSCAAMMNNSRTVGKNVLMGCSGYSKNIRMFRDVFQFLPVMDVLKVDKAQGGPGDDQSIVTMVPDLIEGFVKGLEVFDGCILGGMVFWMYQVNLDLQGCIGKQSQQMGFCGMLDRHNVQDHNALGPDILVDGTAMVHDEDILLPENIGGGQVVWYINRHDLPGLCINGWNILILPVRRKPH